MSSVKYRGNQEGEGIIGKRGHQEGEDIIGRRGNQEEGDTIGRRGNQEGEDIIGRRGNQEEGGEIGKQGKGKDMTRNDYPGRILGYQIPLEGARNFSFYCVASNNIHHVLSFRYEIVISVMCLGLRSLKGPDRDYQIRQPRLQVALSAEP